MHAEAKKWVADTLTELPSFERVLEIGSYNVNGSIKPVVQLLSGAPDYTGIDVREGPGVDEVVDGATYEANPFDLIVCCETLEHAPNADDVIANAYKLLKRGGYFVATMATHNRSPHTNDGDKLTDDSEFYANVHPVDVQEWCKRFRQVTMWIYESRGDLYVLAKK